MRHFGRIPIAAVAGALLAASGMALAQPVPAPPSQSQIDLVEGRRADFPAATFVEETDWFGPLQLVRGAYQPLGTGRPIPAPLARQLNGFFAATNSYAMVVAHDGKIVFEKYKPGQGPAKLYDTASMHKTVVGILTGIAIDRGTIADIDDTVGQYLPEWQGHAIGDMTIRHLLEMTSGFRTPPLSSSSASPYWQSYFGDDLKWSMAQWPIDPTLAGQFYYANANTQFLSWVLERASGRRYADLLSGQLWQRIDADNARLWLDREGGSPRASCCLQATARDWVRVGELIRSRGRWRGQKIVSVAWIDAMLAPSLANPNFGRHIWRGSPHNPRRSYGADIPAIMEAKAPFKRSDTYYIDGSGGQRVYIIPSQKLVIVRIGKPMPDWDDSALPNMLCTKEYDCQP